MLPVTFHSEVPERLGHYHKIVKAGKELHRSYNQMRIALAAKMLLL